MSGAKITITVTVDETMMLQLSPLAASTAVEARPRESYLDGVTRVVQHLVNSAADGMERPGSWERGWLEQAFGSWDGSR